MELQTSATKEQINRLQSQLKRALEMASSSAQKSAETVQSNHIASQQALKLEYEEENNRLRKFVDETVKSLDATREQQQEQQLLYRRQIHELSAVYNRTKLAQVRSDKDMMSNTCIITMYGSIVPWQYH